MKIVALDCETFRIGPGAVAPKVVCASLAWRRPDGEMASLLVSNGDSTNVVASVRSLLLDPEVKIVTHSGGFDYACLMSDDPDLIPLIFQALEEGRCTDTLWREKLLNLSTTGKLEQLALPDGSSTKIRYDLAGLEQRHIGRDRTEEKSDEEEGWRVNYSVLDGWKSADYPEDAARYALEDAEGTLLVYEAQEQYKEIWEMASTQTEEFQLASSLALYLMSAWGMATDPVAVEAMHVEVQKRLDRVVGDLVEVGFLRPGTPSMPYKSQVNKAVGLLEVSDLVAEGSSLSEMNWAFHREFLEGLGIKYTEAKDPTKNTKVIQAYVADLFKRLGKIPAMTAGGEREPQIQLDAEVQEMLAAEDPIMEKFHAREMLSKIVGQQLPLLRGNAVVHPRYDALKETGRTSSYGNPKGKSGLYPAVHIQGVPKEIDGIDPRQCYVPRPGRAFFDCDYTALELACVGQTTYDLFGESVHLQRYNEGVDLHGYLGAQLVVEFAVDGLGREFTEGCREEGILSDEIAVYHAFMECKTYPAFFKEWRNFAKTTGLGFPGGLGPETMVEFARKTYKVTMTEDQARNFRDKWRLVYPEMPKYFDWLTGQTDPYNTKDGEALYAYTTPLGMIRRGATYSAAANGKCMQSPGAEGAKAALIRLSRACYDPSQGSVLFGCRPIAFIHDQIIGETTEDEALWAEQCIAVRDLMCESMRLVLPNVNVRSDESHLTSVWSKQSVPTFGPEGRLIPWRPTNAKLN